VKLKLLLTPDGKLLVSVPEGTFEEARAAIEAVLRDLGLDGLPLVLETPIEQHRHDAEDMRARHDVHERPGA
jgi:endonuclease IV